MHVYMLWGLGHYWDDDSVLKHDGFIVFFKSKSSNCTIEMSEFYAM